MNISSPSSQSGLYPTSWKTNFLGKLKVYAFLTSASVDLVRTRAVELAPLDPLKALTDDFIHRGGTIWACPPCVKSRGYAQEDFIEGVAIIGASAMHERLNAGAASLSF